VKIIIILLNITVTQYLHIINFSLTFPAIEKLRTQGKRVKKKEKRKFQFLYYLLGQKGGNPGEEYSSCTVITVMLPIAPDSRQRSQNCATDLYKGAWGECS